MQTKYKLIFIFICTGLVALQSCDKDYFDLNENPNQVTTPSLPSLLSTATHKTGINNYNGILRRVYFRVLCTGHGEQSGNAHHHHH